MWEGFEALLQEYPHDPLRKVHQRSAYEIWCCFRRNLDRIPCATDSDIKEMKWRLLAVSQTCGLMPEEVRLGRELASLLEREEVAKVAAGSRHMEAMTRGIASLTAADVMTT